jgi:hypothetical protein
LAQAAQLLGVTLSAVHGERPEAGQMRGVALEGGGDLQGQLARRRQHQRLDAAGVRREARQQR